MLFKKAYAAVYNMWELLLIEQNALTHSAGEAISPEGRVFRPKALQGRLDQNRVTTINITSIESKPGLCLPLPFDLPPDNETPYTCTSTKPRVERRGLNRSWYLG
jgi:hypothetical protein